VADSELYEHVDKVRQHNLECVFHGDGLCVPQANPTGLELCCNHFTTRYRKEKREQKHLLLHLIIFID
jgi:hypothetical protein